MNWIAEEKRIYNEALKAVETTNQSLIKVYLITQKEIEEELKRFYLTVDPSWSKQYQAQRLTELFKTVNLRLSKLTKISTETIEKAFLREYQETFNSYAYNLSDYFSTGEEFPLLPFTVASEATIKAALNEKIGEYSFKSSMAKKQIKLRQDLREAVAISINKGESTAKLTARLKEMFDTGISRYVATARTELMRSFSIAQDEAVIQALEMDIKFKYQWLGRNDGRERESHIVMNGTYAKIDKDGMPVFKVGQSKGTGPRLLTGPDQAKQCINCRCRRLNLPVTK
jgi:hypothetical protein